MSELPKSQHVSRVESAGGPDKLVYTTAPVPTAGDDEVLIRVAAIGVNFVETYQRSGIYSMNYPFIPGNECSGTVVEVGTNVTGFQVGDRIMTNAANEGYAEYATVKADKALKVSDDLDLVAAAAIPLQGMTAHYLARSSYPIQEGDWVLIHAGAGGVGLILTQMAKIIGARIITTASTEEKRKLSEGAGADFAIGYENFASKVREITDGEGVAAVYDGVGKDTYLDSIASVRPRGHVVIFGAASGQVPPIDIQLLNRAGSVYISRPGMGDFLRTPEEFEWRASEIFEWMEAGQLQFSIGGKYPLEDAARAHTDLESRRTTGKLLLIPEKS